MMLIFMSVLARGEEATEEKIITKVELITKDELIDFQNGKNNIAFETELKIIEPIILKVANSFTNFAYLVDYQCVDNFVYMNYQWGNSTDANNSLAERGLFFVYKANVLKNERYWQQYQEKLEDVRQIRRNLK